MQESENTRGYDNLIGQLNLKTDSISAGDFRFHNVGRIPLMAKHTYQRSNDCPDCRSNIAGLERLIELIPECFTHKEKLREFDMLKQTITKHLTKQHGIRYANYYYSLYTFIGFVVGTGAGILLQSIFQQRLWIVFALAGTTAGAAYGKLRERREYQRNRLM